MRQIFEETGGPAIGRANVSRLREAMTGFGLDGFYIPHEDEYDNEYLPAYADRLAWATGFTGSAGAAFVFADQAIVFVDGRYTLQAATQLDKALFETADLHGDGPFGWLAASGRKGQTLGYDPRLMSPDALAKLDNAAKQAGLTLTPVQTNPIDAAWIGRPAEPMAPVVPHDLAHAGEDSTAKRARIGKGLADRGADALVLTSPTSLAWLFNVRGGDVARSPLPLGRAILHASGEADLYLAPAKVSDALRAHLGNEVALHDIADLETGLCGLKGKTVSVDPGSAAAWFFGTLDQAGASILKETDPTVLPRACKNPVEVEGARQAHVRDGVAMARYLHWLATEGQSGEVDEIGAVKALEAFREETGALKDLSFDTISGAGPNGAIVHYRVTGSTNRKLEVGSLFLVDSGAQYLDGTTDITRTVAIGSPSREMVERYTRVLKGHIALSRVRFPAGTPGSALDTLARMSLWEAGLDYAHGTGHGVGSYLGVHEGPQRIAKAPNTVALRAGMIVSNEPGYYKTGAYGIRIENLQVVTPAEAIAGGDIAMHGFETLTLAPLDRALIEPGLLSEAEWVWADQYHARVLAEIGPKLDSAAADWLRQACAPL